MHRGAAVRARPPPAPLPARARRPRRRPRWRPAARSARAVKRPRSDRPPAMCRDRSRPTRRLSANPGRSRRGPLSCLGRGAVVASRSRRASPSSSSWRSLTISLIASGCIVASSLAFSVCDETSLGRKWISGKVQFHDQIEYQFACGDPGRVAPRPRKRDPFHHQLEHGLRAAMDWVVGGRVGAAVEPDARGAARSVTRRGRRRPTSNSWRRAISTTLRGGSTWVMPSFEACRYSASRTTARRAPDRLRLRQSGRSRVSSRRVAQVSSAGCSTTRPAKG